MGLESPYDFDGLGEDADVAIAAANEYIVRPRADAMEIITLATSARK